jgi:hypothetical protein
VFTNVESRLTDKGFEMPSAAEAETPATRAARAMIVFFMNDVL